MSRHQGWGPADAPDRNGFKKSSSVTVVKSWTKTVMVNGIKDKWETTGGNYWVIVNYLEDAKTKKVR